MDLINSTYLSYRKVKHSIYENRNLVEFLLFLICAFVGLVGVIVPFVAPNSVPKNVRKYSHVVKTRTTPEGSLYYLANGDTITNGVVKYYAWDVGITTKTNGETDFSIPSSLDPDKNLDKNLPSKKELFIGDSIDYIKGENVYHVYPVYKYYQYICGLQGGFEYCHFYLTSLDDTYLPQTVNLKNINNWKIAELYESFSTQAEYDYFWKNIELKETFKCPDLALYAQKDTLCLIYQNKDFVPHGLNLTLMKAKNPKSEEGQFEAQMIAKNDEWARFDNQKCLFWGGDRTLGVEKISLGDHVICDFRSNELISIRPK